MEQLEKQIIQWANDRNIIHGSTTHKQLDKALEEFNELQRALGKQDLLIHADYALAEDFIEVKQEMQDAFGDILVCLINAMAMEELSMKDCLEHAYNEIKDRKGTMINGKFVKEQ